MRLAVFSDSHDNLDALKTAVAMLPAYRPDLLIHLGDIISPFAARMLLTAAVPVQAVFGNNDGETAGLRSLLDISHPPRPLHLEGRRLLLLHEPAFSAKDLAEHAFILHGHTHKIRDENREGCRILNPGELCGWLTETSSFLILDLPEGRAEWVRFARK
jgi:uncharacterized protein